MLFALVTGKYSTYVRTYIHKCIYLKYIRIISKMQITQASVTERCIIFLTGQRGLIYMNT